MGNLFIVTEFNIREFEKDAFIEGKYYVVVNNSKIYTSQFDDLMLYNGEVVVATKNKGKIKEYQEEINDFYKKYPRGH